MLIVKNKIKSWYDYFDLKAKKNNQKKKLLQLKNY